MKTKYMVLFTLIFLMMNVASAIYITEGVSNTQIAGGVIYTTDGVNNTQSTSSSTSSSSSSHTDSTDNSNVVPVNPPTTTPTSVPTPIPTQTIIEQTTLTAQQSVLPIDIKISSFNMIMAAGIAVIIIGTIIILIKKRK